jgi:hypothetical protein
MESMGVSNQGIFDASSIPVHNKKTATSSFTM